jgi:hypothetical protein
MVIMGFRLSCLRLIGNLLSDGFDYFASFVLTAAGAGAVRQLRLMAVRALRERWFPKSVVSAPFLGARIRVASFWIRHFLVFPFRFRGEYL